MRPIDIYVGKVGRESAAAKFAAATTSSDFSIQEEKPYAEVCYFAGLQRASA